MTSLRHINEFKWEESDVAAIVYDELRRIARSTRRHSGTETMCTTALVHEAYVKLASASDQLEGPKHFYVVAAKAMRQILVDYARERGRLKRRPAGERIQLDDVIEDMSRRHIDLQALDEALDRLASVDSRKSRVVELRFFAGLDIERTAEVLDIGHATVERDWRLAKAWLRRELHGDGIEP